MKSNINSKGIQRKYLKNKYYGILIRTIIIKQQQQQQTAWDIVRWKSNQTQLYRIGMNKGKASTIFFFLFTNRVNTASEWKLMWQVNREDTVDTLHVTREAKGRPSRSASLTLRVPLALVSARLENKKNYSCSAG